MHSALKLLNPTFYDALFLFSFLILWEGKGGCRNSFRGSHPAVPNKRPVGAAKRKGALCFSWDGEPWGRGGRDAAIQGKAMLQTSRERIKRKKKNYRARRRALSPRRNIFPMQL